MSSKEHSSPPPTARSENFRHSVHLIPPPRTIPKLIDPLELKWWVLIPAGLFMIVLATGLEVALFESTKMHGFPVPQKNVFSFVSTSFLTSFFPILFVAPLVWLWVAVDWQFQEYHPYIALSRGNATPEESVLLDYISMNKFYALWHAYDHRHGLVVAAGLTSLATLIFQPLAGSIFSIIQTPAPSWENEALSLRTLGLDPNFQSLNSVLGAAGFVDAAVTNNLTDPPFIMGGWATADFGAPAGEYLNGNMTVNTTGIRTTVNCTAPQSFTLSTPSATNDSYSIRATSAGGCALSIAFDPSDGAQQYNVTDVPNCGPNAAFDVSRHPVFFWFYRNKADGGTAPQAQGVFCAPFIEVFDVTATLNIPQTAVTNITRIAQVDTQRVPNNVTGAPFNGVALNGVVFPPSADVFTDARAKATTSAVSGAIFRAALLLPGNGFQNAFDNPNVFLNLTSKVYTQHLSIVAKSTYLLPSATHIPAVITFLQPRLWIDRLSAHLLASALLLVGLTTLILQHLHRRARRHIRLAAVPGSLAAAAALTAHSGWGARLYPHDDRAGMRRKMRGLVFGVEGRTGAVVAVEREGGGDGGERYGEGEEGERERYGEGERYGDARVRESLMGRGYTVEDLKTPYDASP